MLHAAESLLASRERAAAAISRAESRVLRLLASSLSLGEIAGELYLSRNTVKSHARSLYRKLGVATRSQAVDCARREGLL
jgi:LuxR family maltose regulon positive regulatory protein